MSVFGGGWVGLVAPPRRDGGGRVGRVPKCAPRSLAGCRAAHRALRRLAQAADDHLRLPLPARGAEERGCGPEPAKQKSICTSPPRWRPHAAARREGWAAWMGGLKLTLSPHDKAARGRETNARLAVVPTIKPRQLTRSYGHGSCSNMLESIAMLRWSSSASTPRARFASRLCSGPASSSASSSRLRVLPVTQELRDRSRSVASSC